MARQGHRFVHAVGLTVLMVTAAPAIAQDEGGDWNGSAQDDASFDEAEGEVVDDAADTSAEQAADEEFAESAVGDDAADATSSYWGLARVLAYRQRPCNGASSPRLRITLRIPRVVACGWHQRVQS